MKIMINPEMKTIPISGVGEIDLERLKFGGFEGVILDLDGTMHPRKMPTEMSEEGIALVLSARELSMGVAIATNNTSEFRNRQASSLLYEVPCISPNGNGYRRKPNPDLLLAGCAKLGVDPTKTAMVGDKYTLDGKAARRAGLPLFFWVERLGTEDHIGDRLFRRPVREWPVRKIIEMSQVTGQIVSDLEADFSRAS